MRRTTTLFVAVLALLHGIDSSTWAADVAIGVMRDGRPDYLTRTSDEIDRTTVEQGFRHPAQSVAFLFASDLPRDERSLGYEPCLPDARIDRVEWDGNRIGLFVTMPDRFLDTLDENTSESILYALISSLQQVEGVSSATILVRRSDEPGHRPLSRYVPQPPPVMEKPFEAEPDRFPGQSPQPGQGQSAGSLSGKSVFLSAGHGWYYSTTTGSWITQRGNTNSIVEDFTNAEAVNAFLVQYLWNAGAGVYTCRERAANTNELIVDNGAAGYADAGGWTTSTSTGDFYGADYRVRLVSTTGGAEATWSFNPPGAGIYSVYCWYTGGSNRSTDARYIVHHRGGDTVVIQNQQRDGFTWKHLGQFYFDPADPAGFRAVTLTNQGSDPTKYVIADAVRFGGGMGSIADGGSISGRPRWEESGLYYAPFMGCASCISNTVSTMPRYAKWENESWEDSIYFSWHTNAPDPGTGTSTFVYTTGDWGDPFEGVEGSEELQDYVHAEIMNDIRQGYDSGWQDRGQWTADFGEINPSHNDEMPACLIEVAFHDTPSDANYLKDPKFRMISARAIYQGIEKFFAWKDGRSPHLLPEPPVNVRAINQGNGTIRVSWSAPPFNSGNGLLGDAADSYRIYISSDGYGWADGEAVAATYHDVEGVAAGEAVYVKVTAVNEGGESFGSPVLAAQVPPTGVPAALLIVDGFDRIDRNMLLPQWDSGALGTNLRTRLDHMNSYAYIRDHAASAALFGGGFDSCVNEAVAEGHVGLAAYQAVDWICGEESTTDETFSSAEQASVSAYLAGGGGLFVSGAEVGWDLDAMGGAADRAFYINYLKTDYAADDAGVGMVAGDVGGIFAGLSGIAFDTDGSDSYNVDYPDAVSAYGGSVAAMTYSGTAYKAAVVYDGSFRVVSAGFPFETIIDRADRDAVMERVLDFLIDAIPTPAPTGTPTPGTGTPTPTGTPQPIPAERTGGVAMMLAGMGIILCLRIPWRRS